MAQLLLQGTNFMNFMGRYVYVATGKHGFEAIAVAEHDEPEAIFGSDLQRIAYPDNYKNFLQHHRELSAAAEHSGNVLDIQARGEYAYAALGPGGLRVYDIANIDNKNFSERVTHFAGVAHRPTLLRFHEERACGGLAHHSWC